MTRSELLATIARRINANASSLDTATQTRLLELLNERHRWILSQPGMSRLRDRTTTVDSVADQEQYGLVNVSRVYRIWDTTNDRVLGELSADQYRRIEPDPDNNPGTPSHFIWDGYGPVAAHPSNASELFVKSTAAGDTTQTAYLEGEITGGYPRTASVTLTGTTAVTFASTITTWERITKFYLSAAPAGVITLHEDSGVGTELARLAIGQTRQRYSLISLWPTPSDAITYRVDYQHAVTDLAQNTDEPLLPLDFHDVLVFGVLAEEFGKKDDTRSQLYEAKAEARLRQLKYWMAETQTGQTALSGGPEVPSRFTGGYYPSGPY